MLYSLVVISGLLFPSLVLSLIITLAASLSPLILFCGPFQLTGSWCFLCFRLMPIGYLVQGNGYHWLIWSFKAGG